MSVDRAEDMRRTLARLWNNRSHKSSLGISQAAKEESLCADLRKIREGRELE